MKSLLELPSKEFVHFIGTVKDYQQTSRLGCTFWLDGKACFCNITVQTYHIFAKIQPIDSKDDLGRGCGNAVEKMFERSDVPENKVSVSATYNGKLFKHSTTLFQHKKELKDIKEALVECQQAVEFMIQEFIEDPTGERQKVRQAVHDQWLANIVSGKGDKNGEFVPSDNQVLERLAARFKILDKNGVEMPRHPSGRLRTLEEAVAMQDRLNKNGEYKPYSVIENV